MAQEHALQGATAGDGKQKSRNLKLGCLAALGSFVAVCVTCGVCIAEAPTTTDVPASLETKRIAWDVLGCSTREDLDHVVGLMQDHAAFEKFLRSTQTACRLLPSGTEVVLTDTAVMHGVVKVRPKGALAELWVPTEAVQ